MDPKRLINDTSDHFGQELLRAGQRDAMTPEKKAVLMGTITAGAMAPPIALGIASLSQAGNAAATGTAVGVGQGAVSPAAAAAAAPLGVAAVGKGVAGLGIGKVIAGAGAVVGLTALGFMGLSTPEAPQVTEITPAVAVQPMPEEVTPSSNRATEAVSEIQEVEEPVSPPHEVKPTHKRRIHKTPTAAPAASSLTQELSLIDAARSALAARNPTLALKKLSAYSSSYPKGKLRAEASVLRIQALVAAGRRSEAQRLGEAFLSRAPNGPYSRRIRSLLGMEK